MKTTRSTLALTLSLTTLTLLTGCFGGGAGSSSSVSPIQKTFSDPAVTDFFQRGNYASIKVNPMQFIWNNMIATAYAGDEEGKISCLPPEPVTFDMVALTTPVVVETQCGADILTDIRVGLLGSMAGKDLEVIIDHGEDYAVEFMADGTTPKPRKEILFASVSEAQLWTDQHTVFSGSPDDIALCYDKLSFNQDKGTVSAELDEVATSGADLETCYASEADSSNNYCGEGSQVAFDALSGVDQIAACKPIYNSHEPVQFRFKNGCLEFADTISELDSGSVLVAGSVVADGSNENYNRFCVK